MPRNTRTSQASASREKPIVLSGDEDGAVPPRMRLDEEVYEQLREKQRSFTKEMYAFAVAYLQRTLERTRTEGIGDCWLLTIMASFEVKDRNHVASLRDDQREDICTKRRRAIVKWAADSKSNGGFSLLCEMLGYSVDFERERGPSPINVSGLLTSAGSSCPRSGWARCLVRCPRSSRPGSEKKKKKIKTLPEKRSQEEAASNHMLMRICEWSFYHRMSQP